MNGSPVTKDDVVAVIGAGTMGAGIAQVAAAAGHTVRLYDAVDGAVARGIEKTAAGLDRLVARGRVQQEECDALLARIHPADSLEALADAALVIEAIIEDLGIKREVFSKLESICAPDAILASNTSSLSITAIGAHLDRPGRLVGMHFFNPAPVMKLVEVISGLDTEPSVAARVFDTAARWGKHPVHARSTPGFIVNRVARPFYGEALRLVEERAADFAVVDKVVRDAGGFPMGPFELMDLIGIDVNYAVSRSVYDAYYQDPRFSPSLEQKERVDGGRLGRKSGRGFYDYRDNAAAVAAPPASPCPAPEKVAFGTLGLLQQPLVRRIAGAGIAIDAENEQDGIIRLPNGVLALTDGRTATRRSFEDMHPNLVLFDLCLDYAAAPALALAPCARCTPYAVEQAIGLMQAAGIDAYVIADTPALVVMRLVCMLVNEACDAVLQGVCDARGVDTAMQGGVNYPRGPLAWADAIGADTVFTVLNHLQQSYGSDRYRPSLLLQQHVYSGTTFHEPD